MGIAPYAKRVETLSGSAVREILKLTQQPDIISFGGGMPSEDAFPTADLQRIMHQIIDHLGGTVLQYGVTEGYEPLKTEIVNMVAGKNIHTTNDQILITSGSQQGIDLVAKAFLDRGDQVIVESPTYLSALQVFHLYEADLLAAPVDDDGIIPAQLEHLLNQHGERVKMLYLIPTFQNPTGKAMSLTRRQEIMAIAHQHQIIVVEDDPYSDLRYSGEPLPPLKSLEQSEQVVYLGSFSKIVAPGLRVGYAIAHASILSKMIIGKQACDVHTAVFAQMVIAEYLHQGLLPAHLRQINAMYKGKRDLMLQCLAEAMPPAVRWTRPDGGLFLWLELPSHMDAGRLFTKAIAEKVAFVAGDSFFAHGDVKNAMRLNFSNATPENIKRGIATLGAVIKANL